jgi:predicted ArsR family transcriptional regulator
MIQTDEYPLFSGTDTRREAASSIPAETLRAHCLAILQSYGPLTADEIAMKMHQSILAVRPRVTELKQLDLVEETELRRPNASGRRAVVVRLKRGEA